MSVVAKLDLMHLNVRDLLNLTGSNKLKPAGCILCTAANHVHGNYYYDVHKTLKL